MIEITGSESVSSVSRRLWLVTQFVTLMLIMFTIFRRCSFSLLFYFNPSSRCYAVTLFRRQHAIAVLYCIYKIDCRLTHKNNDKLQQQQIKFFRLDDGKTDEQYFRSVQSIFRWVLADVSALVNAIIIIIRQHEVDNVGLVHHSLHRLFTAESMYILFSQQNFLTTSSFHCSMGIVFCL